MFIEPGDVKYLNEDIAIVGCYNQEDGCGYIHCLLEAFHPTYAKMRNGNYRIYLAKSLRLGALPEIIKTNYRPDDLSKYAPGQKHFSINNPYSVYTNASTYGTSLEPELLKYYAKYLNVSYRLFNANLDVIEEATVRGCPHVNIFQVSDSEYHLLVRPHRAKRGDDDSMLRYSVFDMKMSWL